MYYAKSKKQEVKYDGPVVRKGKVFPKRERYGKHLTSLYEKRYWEVGVE